MTPTRTDEIGISFTDAAGCKLIELTAAKNEAMRLWGIMQKEVCVQLIRTLVVRLDGALTIPKEISHGPS